METPHADRLKVIHISTWKRGRFFRLLLQEWNELKRVKQCSPRALLVLFDGGCSVCGAVTSLVVFCCFCSRLADDAWPSHFSLTVDLRETSEPLLSRPSSLLFPDVLPLLSPRLVWPLCRFFLEVSLIPATAGSSLSVDPPPPSLMCFLVLLTDFFSGLAGINRGDDGRDSMVPALETLETKWKGKKCFVVHFVFKLVCWNQELGLMSKKCWWISFRK